MGIKNYLVVVAFVDPVGERPESVVRRWATRRVVRRLSTRPEGRRPVRRTRPQVHKVLRNIAETELCYHHGRTDSANPWRNDGSGLNKYYR